MVRIIKHRKLGHCWFDLCTEYYKIFEVIVDTLIMVFLEKVLHSSEC